MSFRLFNYILFVNYEAKNKTTNQIDQYHAHQLKRKKKITRYNFGIRMHLSSSIRNTNNGHYYVYYLWENCYIGLKHSWLHTIFWKQKIQIINKNIFSKNGTPKKYFLTLKWNLLSIDLYIYRSI